MKMSDKKMYFAFVAVFVVIISGILLFAIVSDDNTDNQDIEISKFNYSETPNTNTSSYATANISGNTLSVTGVFKEDSSADLETRLIRDENNLTLVLESLDSSNTDSENLEEYKYQVEINSEKNISNLYVQHPNDKKFKVYSSEETEDNNKDSEDKNSNISDNSSEGIFIDILSKTSADYENNSSTSGIQKKYARNNKTVIYGYIVGSEDGMKPVVENINIGNKEVKISIGLEKSDNLSPQVLTNYTYKAVISDSEISKYHKVNVIHNKELRQDSDNLSVEVQNLNRSISERPYDRVNIIEWTEDSISIRGSMKTTTSGHSVIVDNYSYKNGRISLDLRAVNDRNNSIVNPVITPNAYDIKLENLRNAKALKINHIGGKNYIFKNSSDGVYEVNDTEKINADIVSQNKTYTPTNARTEIQRLSTDEAVVYGSIIGPDPARSLYIKKVQFKNQSKTTEVTIGIKRTKPVEQPTIQVLTQYNYKMKLNGLNGSDVDIVYDRDTTINKYCSVNKQK